MAPGDTAAPLPKGAPSILGSPYLTSHGSHSIIVGATKSFGWGAEDALAMCQPPMHIVMRAGQHGSTAGTRLELGQLQASQGAQASASDGMRGSAGVDDDGRAQSGFKEEPSDGLAGLDRADSCHGLAGGKQHGSQASSSPNFYHDPVQVQAAEGQMLQGAAQAWPAIRQWTTVEIRWVLLRCCAAGCCVGVSNCASMPVFCSAVGWVRASVTGVQPSVQIPARSCTPL